MTNDRREKIKKVFESNNLVVKTSLLRKNKVCSRDIAELIDSGYVKKIKTGFYAWNEYFEDLSDFEVVNRIIPNGVISVYSAASIHELTTVNPMNISVTIPNTMLKPTLPEYPPIDIFFTSNKYLLLGVMEFKTNNMLVSIYDPERTVCDFFKYVNRVGRDVALEVLKNYMMKKNKNLQLLFEYAGKLRVKKNIKPYVEALL